MKKIYNWYKRERIVLFSIIIFLVIIAAFASLIIYIINQFGEVNAKYINDLLQIILSWPVLGIVAFFVFIRMFSDSLNIFLSSHKPKIPGTDEKQQKPEIKEEITNKDKADDEAMEEGIEEIKIQSEIHEFNYLALFFIDTTKRVLKWIFDSREKEIVTYDSYNIAWQSIIIDSNNRATIFNVLRENGMIDGVLGGAFSVTDKGERFLRFIGFIR